MGLAQKDPLPTLSPLPALPPRTSSLPGRPVGAWASLMPGRITVSE